MIYLHLKKVMKARSKTDNENLIEIFRPIVRETVQLVLEELAEYPPENSTEWCMEMKPLMNEVERNAYLKFAQDLRDFVEALKDLVGLEETRRLLGLEDEGKQN